MQMQIWLIHFSLQPDFGILFLLTSFSLLGVVLYSAQQI